MAVQQLLQLPPGLTNPAGKRVIVLFVVEKDGRTSHLRVTQSAGPALDSVVVAAVRQLPRFQPGQLADQPVRMRAGVNVVPGEAPPGFDLPPTAVDTAAEARTLRRGLAERRPAEAVADFLGRVLPVSFPAADKPISYAWHPRADGPQLFFSAPGNVGPGAEYERNLFVLDPIGPTQYAVQSFGINQGDITTLEALFFADANHDGQKDLLALTECSLRDGATKEYPLGGRRPHYQTTVIYYRGPEGAGRPRYEQQYREDLDELATAAAVRQALAAPPKRPAAPLRPAKPAKR